MRLALLVPLALLLLGCASTVAASSSSTVYLPLYQDYRPAATATSTPTVTRTATQTATPTRTATGTATATPSPTATPLCPVARATVYAIAGQSNAVGITSEVYTATQSFLLRASSWQPLSEQSYWPLVADALTGSVAFVQAAKGSTAIAEWAPDGALYANLVQQARAAGGVEAVLWWQGESDVAAGTAQSDYLAALTQLAAAVQHDLAVPLVVAKLGQCPIDRLDNWQAINGAIEEAWQTAPNVREGPDFSDMQPDDAYHFLQDSKAREVARRWAVVLSRLQ